MPNKTITVDHLNLETEIATCNFCGQKCVVCVRSSLPFYGPETKPKEVIDGDIRPRIIGEGWIVQGFTIKRVATNKYVSYDNAHICPNCIEQLHKWLTSAE